MLKNSYTIKQVEVLEIWTLNKYDEELFTILFDFTNKIKIRKIRIVLDSLLSNEDKKNICAKIEDKIKRSIFSNDVSCFI